MAEALIALGGNVGDVRATLDRAIAHLCDGRSVRLLARSSDYRTPPWGVTDQPPFVNCASRSRPRWRRTRCSAARQAVERGSAATAPKSSAGARAPSIST